MTRSKTCSRATAATAKLRQDAHEARMAVVELKHMAMNLVKLMSEADRRLRVSAEALTAAGLPDHAEDARYCAAGIVVSRAEWLKVAERDLAATIDYLNIPF